MTVELSLLCELVDRELKELRDCGLWVPAGSHKEILSDNRRVRSRIIKYIRDGGYGEDGLIVYGKLLSLIDEIHAHIMAEKYIRVV